MSRYRAYRDGHAVLDFRAEPGVLVSAAIAPPGFEPPSHPFLNARALDPFCEQVLGEIARSAGSFEEFVAMLGQRGFEVRAEP